MGGGIISEVEKIIVEPDLWSVAEDVPIPDSAHEYHMRKALNDAAYRGLDYIGYDPNMPIAKEGCPTDEARFMWKKKAPK
mmetsp:Transcript_39560/g.101139  ORF Transcript_39560/g.101139 Transcript_39560/m.101139 type:complete len:80 (-) Transcript_39560:128-367(-)